MQSAEILTFGLPGQPISSSTPMDASADAPLQETVTIGEALEAIAVRAGDRPIDAGDASAIQSAEKRATGSSLTMPGGLAATAQAAAELNPRVEDFAKTTLSDVLMDASMKLSCDKVVTWGDVEKVAGAELRNKHTSQLQEGGVTAAFVAAAEFNDKVVFTPSSQIEQLKVE